MMMSSAYSMEEPKTEMKKADNSSESSSLRGLVISNTEAIRSFILASAPGEHLSLQPSVSYNSLRSIWFASDPSSRPDLLTLLSGSTFIFPSPKPREKSEELKVRLRKLEEVAERKAYDELIKDITPRKGLHVVLAMFTGFLVGYAIFRALFGHSPVMNAAGGILGLVGAMLIETLLFIVRASDLDCRSTFSTSQLKKNQ